MWACFENNWSGFQRSALCSVRVSLRNILSSKPSFLLSKARSVEQSFCLWLHNFSYPCLKTSGWGWGKMWRIIHKNYEDRLEVAKESVTVIISINSLMPWQTLFLWFSHNKTTLSWNVVPKKHLKHFATCILIVLCRLYKGWQPSEKYNFVTKVQLN